MLVLLGCPVQNLLTARLDRSADVRTGFSGGTEEKRSEIVCRAMPVGRPHSALRFGKVTRTPATQAEIFSMLLTFREIFRWVLPPRPGSRRAKMQWGW